MVYVLTDRYEEAADHFDRAEDLNAQLTDQEQIGKTYVELVDGRTEM